MENERQFVGKLGESSACRYLEGMGHVILERNWRSSHLEIDIISLLGNELHIVEVKSRTAPVMAEPQVNVGPTKQRRLARAARAYLRSAGRGRIPRDPEILFDIVTVIFDGERIEMEYYPQAFIPLYV